MTGEFRRCGKRDCYRKVSGGAAYCCTPCATAAGAPAPYEIEPYRPGVHWVHVHSEGCEERHRERGAFTAGELWP
jgi:hypothetical protein